MPRINNSFKNNSLERVDGSTAPSGSARRSDAPAAPQAELVTRTRAPELLQALNSLGQVPDVRQTTVQAVAQRLSNGNLTTADAAHQTATAILQDPSGLGAQPAVATQTTQAVVQTDPTELARLLDTLKQIPILRQEVVSEVSQRLANGQLTTPATVSPTVKAIEEAAGRS